MSTENIKWNVRKNILLSFLLSVMVEQLGYISPHANNDYIIRWLNGKEPACQPGDAGLIPGLGTSLSWSGLSTAPCHQADQIDIYNLFNYQGKLQLLQYVDLDLAKRTS